jgi:hypothetical protein
MTLQIFKSILNTLPYDFAVAVEVHRQALLAHRFTGDAAPTATALVEQAVLRMQYQGQPDDFVADYVVIDDVPLSPAKTDAERRQDLVSVVRLAERAASDAIITPGKLRLLTLDVSRAVAKPEAERSSADKAALADLTAVQARLDAVQYHAATLEAQIDDLAVAEYENWKPAPFPA